jgi:hypothetical protein
MKQPAKRIWLIPTVLCLCLFCGCVYSRSIKYETTSRAAKAPDHPMEIVDSVAATRPYKVIGQVQANAGKLHSVDDTLERLKAEARKMGGDALLDLQQDPAKRGGIAPIGAGFSVDDNLREIWSAKVIIWTDKAQNPEAQ